MGQFVKGDVVVLPFPFTDLTGSKRRPALVVATLSGDDLILCMITSVVRSDAYAIPLAQNDFSTGILPQPSIIRPNRLFTADANLIVRHAGALSKAKLQTVTAKLLEILTG